MKATIFPNLEPQGAAMWYVCYAEPKRVLPLVAALKEDGASVECFPFRFRRRRPRRNAVDYIERPLIGGVFFCGVASWPLGAGYVAGVQLDAIRRMTVGGKVVTVSDDELEPLRRASVVRTELKTKFFAGQIVVVDFGPFKGRKGVVIQSGRSMLKVEIEDFSFPFEISPFLLSRVEA